MYLTSETKKEIFKKHGKSEADSGSPEGQAALFTFRINHLTGHLKNNRKDFATEKALVDLVGKRKQNSRLLKKEGYQQISCNYR